jgi:hypothetical protein
MPRFKKFNFFIGANNAGKSAVLNFLNSQFSRGINKVSNENLTPLERYDGGSKGAVGYAFGVPVSDAVDELLSGISDGRSRQLQRPFATKLVERLSKNGMFWMYGEIGGKPGFQAIESVAIDEWAQIGDQNDWHRIWSQLSSRSGGGFREHWIPQTVEIIQSSQKFSVPKINLIPAKRQIGPKSEGFEDFSGRGLINRLAETQSPDWNRREDREIFDRINLFVGQVTGDADARIEIPHNREQILVHMGGRVLPLASLGTGIHEVILIAAFCTISQNQIVCIEEPEIHLHPLMQRRLIKFLDDETDNQYFIATHSAAFIDTPGSAIFHVTHSGEQVKIRETILADDRYSICADLGYRASDIVQANAVVWVEGPSDRIYVRHWISAVDPDLIEGIHYSIMFYGGRLLSHLGAEVDEVSDFISLRALNRNSAIIMDSDKKGASAGINDTKKRVISEFSGSHEFAWVTAGREIENYVRPELLHKCLAQIYPDTYGGQAGIGRYDHALHFTRKPIAQARKTRPASTVKHVETTVDKVRLAKAVMMEAADLNVLDLKTKTTELVSMIRRSNRT